MSLGLRDFERMWSEAHRISMAPLFPMMALISLSQAPVSWLPATILSPLLSYVWVNRSPDFHPFPRQRPSVLGIPLRRSANFAAMASVRHVDFHGASRAGTWTGPTDTLCYLLVSRLDCPRGFFHVFAPKIEAKNLSEGQG